jgi:hypothetical protein
MKEVKCLIYGAISVITILGGIGFTEVDYIAAGMCFTMGIVSAFGFLCALFNIPGV